MHPADVVELTSSTHPDESLWYANDSPQFAWTTAVPGSASGYSCIIDHDPATIPPAVVSQTGSAASFSDVADGVWYFHVRARDTAGSWGHASHYAVRIDLTPPVTSDTADGKWHNTTVAVTLTPNDAASGTSGGLATTEYAIDGLTWLPGTLVTLTADPLTHTTDKLHTISYWSTDVIGNQEATKTCTVGIDTVKPTTRAPVTASVRRGMTATLKYRVGDAAPCAGTVTVTIKIRNRAGNVVRTIPAVVKTADPLVTYTAKFRCRLAKGTYRFSVYAVDPPGNHQLKAASNKLVVR